MKRLTMDTITEDALAKLYDDLDKMTRYAEVQASFLRRLAVEHPDIVAKVAPLPANEAHATPDPSAPPPNCT